MPHETVSVSRHAGPYGRGEVRFVNRSRADVVFMVVSTPTNAGDRIELEVGANAG
jgi:hypothetical protein